MSKIIITADTSQAEASLDKTSKKIDEVSEKSEQARINIVSNMRRTAELSLFMLEAAGVQISEMTRIQVQAGLRSIEFAVALRNLTLVTGALAPLAVVQVALQGAAIISLLATMQALRANEAEAARSFRALSNAFQLLTF